MAQSSVPARVGNVATAMTLAILTAACTRYHVVPGGCALPPDQVQRGRGAVEGIGLGIRQAEERRPRGLDRAHVSGR